MAREGGPKVKARRPRVCARARPTPGSPNCCAPTRPPPTWPARNSAPATARRSSPKPDRRVGRRPTRGPGLHARGAGDGTRHRPGVLWRHQLLLLTGRLAASWAPDERAAGLDANLLLVLNTTGVDAPTPPLLAPFQSLGPEHKG